MFLIIPGVCVCVRVCVWVWGGVSVSVSVSVCVFTKDTSGCQIPSAEAAVTSSSDPPHLSAGNQTQALRKCSKHPSVRSHLFGQILFLSLLENISHPFMLSMGRVSLSYLSTQKRQK
jgi:hypothetical protein